MGKSANKIKRISKNNMVFVEIKSIKGQQLDLVQAEAISKGKIEGLLPMSVKEGHGSFTLTYNITGMKTLKEYLQDTVMNKELFGFLLQNIFDIVSIINANYFQFSGLLLSLGRVKVEPSSKRLYFIYVPIQAYDNETTLKEFLLKLLDEATFVEGEDLSYVQEYIRILNTGVNFSVFDLEQYINSLTNRGSVAQKTKKCPNCGHLVSADANFCTNCCYSYISKGVTGQTGGTALYNPFDEKDVYEPPVDDELDWGNDEPDQDIIDTDTQPPTDNDNSAGFQDGKEYGLTEETGTTVLGHDDIDDDDIATTVLNQVKVIVKTGYLTRLSNSQKSKIDVPQYHIGRNRANNFIVSDNTAVGRQHAVIIKQEDRFFINDLNSTNKTYVNAKEIPPRQNIEIFDNTKITLANEDFIFNIVVTEE